MNPQPPHDQKTAEKNFRATERTAEFNLAGGRRNLAALVLAGLALLALAKPAWAQQPPPVPPSAAASSSSATTDQDKAKKALDAARLWLEEAKRRLDGGNDRALGFIAVALQKIESAKGDIDRTASEQSDAAAAKAARERAAAEKAAADKAAADKAAAAQAERDKAAAEKAAYDRAVAEREAARAKARADKAGATAPK